MSQAPAPCGTEIAYQRHKRLKQPTCEACDQAHQDWLAQHRKDISVLRFLDESVGLLLDEYLSELAMLKLARKADDGEMVDAATKQLMLIDALVGRCVQAAMDQIERRYIKPTEVRPKYLAELIHRNRFMPPRHWNCWSWWKYYSDPPHVRRARYDREAKWQAEAQQAQERRARHQAAAMKGLETKRMRSYDPVRELNEI